CVPVRAPQRRRAKTCCGRRSPWRIAQREAGGQAGASRPSPVGTHARARNVGTLADHQRITRAVRNAAESALAAEAMTGKHAVPAYPGVTSVAANRKTARGSRIGKGAPAPGGAHHTFVARQTAGEVVHVNVVVGEVFGF